MIESKMMIYDDGTEGQRELRRGECGCVKKRGMAPPSKQPWYGVEEDR